MVTNQGQRLLRSYFRFCSDGTLASATARVAFAKHGAEVGVGAVWEQEKLEARKMLAVGAARREAAVPGIQCTFGWAAFYGCR
jgi:hypothetical protein